jgi:hypothetical protein
MLCATDNVLGFVLITALVIVGGLCQWYLRTHPLTKQDPLPDHPVGAGLHRPPVTHIRKDVTGTDIINYVSVNSISWACFGAGLVAFLAKLQ